MNEVDIDCFQSEIFQTVIQLIFQIMWCHAMTVRNDIISRTDAFFNVGILKVREGFAG